MASKIGESSSSAQTSSGALYAKRGLVSFNNLMQDYGIRVEWNPVLPSKTGTAFPLKEGKITLFSDFFQVLQLPIADHKVLRDTDVSCLPVPRIRIGRKKFFYIHAGVIPGEMQ
ncbi:hypothetical protein Hanom_Chr06g00565741 [Helianthus anomalus]